MNTVGNSKIAFENPAELFCAPKFTACCRSQPLLGLFALDDINCAILLQISAELVYVLRLRGGYYYVGYTRNLDDRILAHMTGNGAVWTQLHPVEEVELVVPGNEAVETAKTLEYMARYGVDKVRGGPWVQTELQNPPLDLLRTNSQRCYGCGQNGHMVNQCPYKNTNQYYAPVQQIYQEDDDFCVRCGRDGHDAEDCYTKVTIDGEYLGNTTCCFRCGRDSHWARDCFAKTDKWGYKI